MDFEEVGDVLWMFIIFWDGCCEFFVGDIIVECFGFVFGGVNFEMNVEFLVR